MAKTKVEGTTKMTVARLAVHLTAQVPDGWQADYHLGRQCMFGEDWEQAGTAYVKFTHDGNDGVVVVLNVAACGTARHDKYDRERAWHGCHIDGDTLLNGASFIRRGIDGSCCELVADPKHRYATGHQYGNLAELLAAQLARCMAVAARRATAVAVPGLPFTVQPDWFAKSAETLRKGGTVRLLPHGMGVGYQLRNDTARGYGRTRASAALEQALGVAPVCIEQLDCD